jgi:hypothetical protein
MDFKSVLAGGTDRADALTRETYPELLSDFPVKFWWFREQGYQPHVWQARSTAPAARSARA